MESRMQACAMNLETTMQKQSLDDLRREVGRICTGAGRWQDITKVPVDNRAFSPAPTDSRLKTEGRTISAAERGPFGRWLLLQVDRRDFIGQLANIARSDRGFPKDGDPDAVRRRLGDTGTDPEMFEAVDDAELDWTSY